MIRVKFNDDEWKEYPDIAVAKLSILTELFASKGRILPIEAVAVLDTTTSGIIVERHLTIELGVVGLK
jgi:hypothetical protein